jgi:membrane-bound lytic murein transglycosylase D
MNHYADHNICPAHTYNTSVALDTIQVNERIHLAQIAGVLDISVSDLRRLNPQFRKDIIPGDFKPYALVLPSEKMYAFIDKGTEITNYQRSQYLTHRSNTDGYLEGYETSVSGNSTNVYYRVKKGDNLSAIARRNGITLSQLKSWNGLRSNRIGIGKRLIVGQKEVPLPAEAKEIEYSRAETSGGGSNIISTYLKEQIEKKGEGQLPEEAEDTAEKE